MRNTNMSVAKVRPHKDRQLNWCKKTKLKQEETDLYALL